MEIILWFDNIPQAQDWKLKLKDFNPSDIASRNGKKYTIEIKVEVISVFLTAYPELKTITFYDNI